MSLDRNRTAPRILTAVNVPDATSLSTILPEQARRKAASFFRNSFSTPLDSAVSNSRSLILFLRIPHRCVSLLFV
jgi:hypothetical protein